MKVLSILALVLFVSASSFAADSQPAAAGNAEGMNAPANTAAPMSSEKPMMKKKKGHKHMKKKAE